MVSFFKLPVRSPIWRAMAPFSLPDWTAMNDEPVPPPAMPIYLSCPDIPTLDSVFTVKTLMKLDLNSGLPFKRGDKVRWTLKEQSSAAKARIPESLDDFRNMVCVFTLSYDKYGWLISFLVGVYL
jgi:hypothetical protein